ncbi:MAG: hypothetical protein HKN26_10960 [Acidimicrobiales bacterium]|nr:hypothetical protein [Acidimicrobiales bacterium]
MEHPPATPEQLDVAEALLVGWLEREQVDNPAVASVERDTTHDRRWYVRLRGEEREFFSALFTLGQRTLSFDSYYLPAPLENHGQFYAHLLRRNRTMYGGSFNIGPEDAIYITGQHPVHTLTEVDLDRMLGSLYAWVEQSFRTALRLGFGSHFTPPPAPDASA